VDREVRMRTDKLSVVIPAHNEEKAIGTVLDELIEVLEGQACEIIVVDDGSTVEKQKGDARDILADVSKAEAKLNWKPRINLNKGLRKYVERYSLGVEYHAR